MIKSFFSNSSDFWKWVFMLVLALAGIATGMAVLFLQIRPMVGANSVVALEMVIIETAVGLFVMSMVLLGFAYLYVRSPLRTMNPFIKALLDEKSLTQHFDRYYSGRSLWALMDHIRSLFTLFKSFDQMKSLRISMESNTIKVLMNSIDVGTVLLNSDQVVTHINHTGEAMLRLIPGEIVGQSFSRKISHSTILESVQTALENDQKITGVSVSIKEETPLEMDIFPIKNRSGDIVRALMLLKPSSSSQT